MSRGCYLRVNGRGQPGEDTAESGGFPAPDRHDLPPPADLVSVTVSRIATKALASRRRTRVAALGALGVVAAAGAMLAGPASPAQAAGRVITISPSDVTYGPTGARSLAGRLQALRAGDTLVLNPGVY